MGLIYYLTPLKENILPILTSIILIFSAFWGGKSASQIAGSKGLIWGLVIGIFLFIIILLATLILGYTVSITAILKKISFCLVGSILGGVFGVSN
jgi:putative membrane protein (TIGR04086 family)